MTRANSTTGLGGLDSGEQSAFRPDGGMNVSMALAELWPRGGVMLRLRVDL